MAVSGPPHGSEIIRIALRITGFPQELCHAAGAGALPSRRRKGLVRRDRARAVAVSGLTGRTRSTVSLTATRRLQNANDLTREIPARHGFAAPASLFIRSRVLGPMPFIARRSSHFVKDLLPVRALIMRSAITGPTPGRRRSESFGAEERKTKGFRRKSLGGSLRDRSDLAFAAGLPAGSTRGCDTARGTGFQECNKSSPR